MPSSEADRESAIAAESTPLLRDSSGNVATNYSSNNARACDIGHHDDSPNGERTTLPDEQSTLKLFAIMGSAWVGVFLGAVDSTIIATLSGPISSEFQSLSLFSWLASAYFIANAASQPISGRLTDIFGRGPGLVVSNILFATGNLICGLARGPAAMILGRVIAGLGGGGLLSISTFLASDLVPLRSRGVVQGFGNLCFGTGAMLGGLFGGLLYDGSSVGWRLAFLLQVPPTVLSGIVVFALVKVPPKQSDRSLVSRIDFGGVALTLAFLVLLLVGLGAGGTIVPWTHPLPLITIPLSAVAFALFVWWESRAPQPVIPVRLLADRTVLAACVTNFLVTMVIVAGLFYGPLFLQVLGQSATSAGLQLLPSSAGASCGSVLSGLVMKRTGRYWYAGIACTALVAVGNVLFSLVDGRTTRALWLLSVGFFCTGTGYGAMLTVCLLAAIAAVDHAQQAVVTSGTYLGRSVGSTLGLTIGSVVYQNVLAARLRDRFGDYPGGADEIRRIRDSLDELKRLPPGWHDGVIASFVEAFHAVMLTLVGLSILAVISISMMREHKLHSNLARR